MATRLTWDQIGSLPFGNGQQTPGIDASFLNALVTLLNGTGFDADTCATWGLGIQLSSQTYDLNTLNTNSGFFSYTNSSTHIPGIHRGVMLVFTYNNTTAIQFAIDMDNTGTGVMKLYTRCFYVTWLTPTGSNADGWVPLWSTGTDGNLGQGPAPKPQTGAGNIGIMTALDVANGGTLTMPAGSGTYQWVVLTYGVTVNSVKTGQTAAGASPGGTASANCTVLVWRIA